MLYGRAICSGSTPGAEPTRRPVDDDEAGVAQRERQFFREERVALHARPQHIGDRLRQFADVEAIACQGHEVGAGKGGEPHPGRLG